jgi:hypothetical protein
MATWCVQSSACAHAQQRDDGWDDAEVELGRTARSAIGPCEFVTVLWTDIQLP